MTIGGRFRRGLGLALLGAAMAPGTQGADAVPKVVDFAKLKEAAGVDLGTRDGMAYMKDNKNALEGAISSAFGKCSAQVPAGKSVAFEFIVGIDTDGIPRDVLVRPDDAFGTCFSQALLANKLGKPPKQPFHIYVNMGAGK